MGFPGGSDGKESAYNEGDLGFIPGWGRFPGGGYGNPPQYSCLEKLHGQRSLVGYSPWSHKESDMTETLSTKNNRRLRRVHFSALCLLFLGKIGTHKLFYKQRYYNLLSDSYSNGRKMTSRK